MFDWLKCASMGCLVIFLTTLGVRSAPPSTTREQAELALSQDIKIERINNDQIRIGKVTLERSTHRIKFPATVNTTTGLIHHALVTESGDFKKSIFTTSSSPRDIHLAMLLLGIKPATIPTQDTDKPPIPDSATVKITVEWETNGTPISQPLTATVALTNNPANPNLTNNDWLYTGSQFDADGFRALRVGTLISLTNDESALINNIGVDRKNKDIHKPNSSLLPPTGTPVSIVITCPQPPVQQRDTSVDDAFLDHLSITGKSLTMTLPNGKPIAGSIITIERNSSHISKLAGSLEHPDLGSFSFTRTQNSDGKPVLEGILKFDNTPIEWVMKPAPTAGRFQLIATPAADSFRPRNPEMPKKSTQTATLTPAAIRETAENALRDTHKITKTDKGTELLGLVRIDRSNRSIRIPVTLNMREGPIEYALVKTTGKTHESLLATDANPADVHVAMRDLGIKPSPITPAPGQPLIVPPTASVLLEIEWSLNGTLRKQPLDSWIALTPNKSSTTRTFAVNRWHYNGSLFNRAGFGAALEGSIISLITDEMALINNPSTERTDDESHLPNTSDLPPVGTAATLIITLPIPASNTES